jgi:aminoglycoside phosphotransferase family enzyme
LKNKDTVISDKEVVLKFIASNMDIKECHSDLKMRNFIEGKEPTNE